MSKGIIISKENHDITQSSENQYVDTKTPLFKLFKFGSDQRSYVSKNLSGVGDTFTIHHGLGYIPMFFLFADRAPSSIRKIVLDIDTLYPENTVLWECKANTQDIVVFVQGGSSVTANFGYNYFIFYDRVG